MHQLSQDPKHAPLNTTQNNEVEELENLGDFEIYDFENIEYEEDDEPNYDLNAYYEWVKEYDHRLIAQRVGLDLDACHDYEVSYAIHFEEWRDTCRSQLSPKKSGDFSTFASVIRNVKPSTDMNFNVKQAIIGRLRETKRDNMEAVIDFMEQHGFFTYYCHSHHHYVGGLADHAWQTYQVALRLAAASKAKHPDAPALDVDSIAIAALLHDLCDCSGMRDIHRHGSRSVGILKRLGFHLTDEEFLAICFHMSLRGKEGNSHYSAALRSPLRTLVHTADCRSAHLRRGCSF